MCFTSSNYIFLREWPACIPAKYDQPSYLCFKLKCLSTLVWKSWILSRAQLAKLTKVRWLNWAFSLWRNYISLVDLQDIHDMVLREGWLFEGKNQHSNHYVLSAFWLRNFFRNITFTKLHQISCSLLIFSQSSSSLQCKALMDPRWTKPCSLISETFSVSVSFNFKNNGREYYVIWSLRGYVGSGHNLLVGGTEA